MWIKIFPGAASDKGPIEFDCINLESNFSHDIFNDRGYNQFVFTYVEKMDFNLDEYSMHNYYFPVDGIVLVTEIDKPSLIPNVNNYINDKLKRQFGLQFRPLKKWEARRTTGDGELFIAEVVDVKSLFYEDILNELAKDVMTYIKEESHGFAKEGNSTITLLLDDGKIKEKYETEFNYVYDEYTEKLSNIVIVKVSKSTYKYPVDFNETDLCNFQKTIDQFKI